MKKFSFLLLCLIFISSPAFSDDENPNPVDTQALLNQQKDIDSDNDSGENAQTIYESYGSIYSPYFNNNGGENPNESNYGYEGGGGAK